MLLRKILPFLILIVAVTGGISAQVYAPAANDSFDAKYNLPGGTDEVFVFNKPDYGVKISASITAVSPDKLIGWTFQWSVFDQATLTYNAIPGSGSGWFSSVDTISVSSGYQVVMTKGIISHTFRIWILINDLDVQIVNKDVDNKLLFGYYNCSSLDLRADSTMFLLYYFNPVSKERIFVDPAVKIRWKTDNVVATVPPSRLNTRVTNPPYEDTWYTLTLLDVFGLERSDSVFYESIQSKAEMTATYVNLGDEAEYPGMNYDTLYADNILSAPGKYRFDLSASKNMASYKIDFGDGESFISGGDTLKVVHEYKLPGNYQAVLTTKSEKPYECTDTILKPAVLLPADAENFGIPNVFTPNNDGQNDVFRCSDVSVLNIDITIFDRAGLKVHTYAGSIRDWNGWDGNVRNSERKAPEGVYFYVISMLAAYEDKSNPIGSKVLRGYFHLYR